MYFPDIQKESLFELKQHGCNDFPYTVYYSSIPSYFHNYPAHWHREMEMILIEKGSCIITINKNVCHVSDGDIIFILPETLHAIEQENHNECDFINIVFDLHMLESDLTDICYTDYIKPYLDNSIKLPDVLKKGQPHHNTISEELLRLNTINQSPVSGAPLLIKSVLYKILWEMLPLQDTQPVAENDGKTEQVQKIKSLLVYVKENFADEITLRNAADYCGYSTSYFMKFFKAFTGVTFLSYLNSFRMKEAAKLLKSSDYSILEIAEKCGIENYSYFIRLFKKQYHVTPHQYRKNRAND